MDKDTETVWMVAYMVALHAMLPRDAPPNFLTSNTSENARCVADNAVKHYNQFLNDPPVEGT